MQRLAWLGLALALGACGSEVDDRPPTLPIIVENILIPNCGTSQCHSTMTQQYGFVFDNIAGARAAIVFSHLVAPGDPTAASSQLIYNLTVDDPTHDQPRMPYDAPLPDVDLLLIENWIENGADGALCAPAGVDVCGTDNNVYACVDGDIGELVAACDPIHGCKTVDTDGNPAPAHCLAPAP